MHFAAKFQTNTSGGTTITEYPHSLYIKDSRYWKNLL